MNVVCLCYLHALKETAAAGFKTVESLMNWMMRTQWFFCSSSTNCFAYANGKNRILNKKRKPPRSWSMLLCLPNSTTATLFCTMYRCALKKLQSVQNAAARLITCSRKYDHIIPILKELHWLPVSERIKFKIMLLTFNALRGQSPVYIQDLVAYYQPSRILITLITS